MFKTLLDDIRWQRLIYYISNYRSHLFQTIMTNRGLELRRGHKTFLTFPGVLLSHSHYLLLKFCKESPRKLNSVSGDWPVRLKGAFNLFSLTNKKIIKRIRKRLWGNDWGQDSASVCAHLLSTETEKLPGTITVYNLFTNIAFLSFPYQIWHQTVLFYINLSMYR